MQLESGRRCEFDVAVLGAGAAGLCAGIRAAETGARVIVLEKNRRAGVKILMSGGTRCNLTNARGLRRLDAVSGRIDPAFDPSLCRGPRAIQAAFGSGGAFLGPALRCLDVDQTVRLFEAEGVATKVEGNGKIFPVTDRAVDVLEALLRRLGRSGAVFRGKARCTPSHRWTAVTVPTRDSTSPSPPRRSRRGGWFWLLAAVSYPGCGTAGDGYAIARELGHRIIDTRPALVPIRVAPDWVSSLRGLSLPDVVASVRTAAGQTLEQRREAILFAHFGLSGPAILDVSRAVARHPQPDGLELHLDLFPATVARGPRRQDPVRVPPGPFGPSLDSLGRSAPSPGRMPS